MKRREFFKTAAAAAGLTVIPIRAQTPGRKLNLAAVGTGGMAQHDLKNMLDENFVAFCDVDQRSLKWCREKFPDAKYYTDFRVMLKEVHDLVDAVTVIVPDHLHATIATEVMKYKKAVFCEKPLARTVAEARMMARRAKETGVITQMGNQGHSSNEIRLLKEFLEDGAIGTVLEVHAWCYFAPRYYYPDPAKLAETVEAPKELDWRLWQGPVPERKYHNECVPQKWRSWYPYGGGIIADWVCHVIDPVFWGLDLGLPKAVTADVDDPVKNPELYPHGVKLKFEFEKDGKPLVIYWYDGSYQVPRPAELETDREFKTVGGAGAYLIGEKGTILHGSHGAGGMRIIPEAKMQAYKRPAQKYPRIKEGHYKNFLNAVRENHPAGSPFEYGARLTEVGLLGVIASRIPGKRLLYDSEGMRFTNSEEATRLLHPVFREEWKLDC